MAEVPRDTKQQEAFVTRKAAAEEKALAVATLWYNQTLARGLNLRLREGALEGQGEAEESPGAGARREQDGMDMLYQRMRCSPSPTPPRSTSSAYTSTFSGGAW